LQCCGSGMFIPDPGSDFFPSRIQTFSIPDPGSSSKNLSILTPKNQKKWFLSSKIYDPDCSSRIRMLTFYPSRIPDPGVKKAPNPGSRIRNTGILDLQSLNSDPTQTCFSMTKNKKKIKLEIFSFLNK
jgi:hypothetical protein